MLLSCGFVHYWMKVSVGCYTISFPQKSSKEHIKKQTLYIKSGGSYWWNDGTFSSGFSPSRGFNTTLPLPKSPWTMNFKPSLSLPRLKHESWKNPLTSIQTPNPTKTALFCWSPCVNYWQNPQIWVWGCMWGWCRNFYYRNICLKQTCVMQNSQSRGLDVDRYDVIHIQIRLWKTIYSIYTLESIFFKHHHGQRLCCQ